MALVKTVEMRVLADAGDAQKRLDELDAKAKDLDGNAIKMRFRVESEEGKAQLDAIEARAKALGFNDVNIKVKVDGAGRAIADLEAVKHEEEKVRDGPSLLDRLGGGVGKLGGLLGGGLPGGLPLIGGTGAAGIAAIAAAAVPLLAELTALVSGFAAAGAGAGAFALLAAPAVKQVQTAYEGLSGAQQKYQAAQAKFAEAPTKANAAALKTAALNLDLAKEAIGKLPAPEQAAVKGIQGLSAEFGKISRAFQPQAFKVFNDALKIANDLLPHVTPFASTFATAMDGLLKTADRAAKSKGFQQFLGQLHGIEGPALTSIGTGLGGLATALGRLLTVMSGKDVAHGINIAFGALIGTINTLTAVVKTAMTVWDGLGIALHNVAMAFDSVRHGAAGIGHDFEHNFDAARHAVATAAHDIAHGFDTVRHTIASKFDGIRHDIASKFDGAGSWLAGRAHDIVSAFDHVRHDIAAKFDGIRHDIAAKFNGAITWLYGVGKDVVQGLINGLKSMIPGLSGAVSTITGVIKSVAGALGIKSPSTVMHGYGVSVVQGLIHGMNSQLPALEAAAKKAAAIIATRIKTETAYAKSVAQSALAGLNLTSIDLTQGTVATGMQSYLTSIKEFIAEIKQLTSMHLSKGVLQQLIAAGPVTGGQYAQSILQGPGGVAQVNALYKQIQQQSALLGAQAAMSMYGGKASPKGDTYNITVQGGLITDKQALALEIVQVLRQYKRHGGNVPLGIG